MKLKNILAFVGCLAAGSAMAQQNLTLYNMSELQQTQAHANPAFTPTAKINIAAPPMLPPFPLPSMYFNMSNSGFKLSHVITQDANGKTYYDFDNMLTKLKKDNYFNTALQIDLVTFGFKLKKNYFSFNLSEKVETRFRYPKALFDVLINGNGAESVLGQEQNFNFGLNATHYTDIGVGYNREINDKLTVGGRLKLLKGHENVYTKKSDVSLTTGSQYFDLTAKSDIAIYTSGLDTNSMDQFGNISPTKYIFGSKNNGLGIDLGGSYKVTEKITASASVLDLGFIKWNQNTYNFVSKNPGASFTYSGVNIQDYLNDSTSIEEAFTNTLDSVSEQFEIGTNQDKYRTFLSSKIYLGGNYKINDKNNAGLLLYGQTYDKKIHPGISLSYNTQVGRWLYATVTYSIYNRSYNNVGLGLVINPGWFQWYIISDNILGPMVLDKYGSVPVPAYTKNLNLRFGFNLTIGKPMKDKDHDGIADKQDACPEIPGLKEMNGCPDKDGDKITDKDDVCPDVAGLAEFKGCPDKDGDKIADKDDACPDVAGVASLQGCPDKDNDGITDAKDECPDEAGTAEFNGCPDKDGDKIIDKNDECPDQAGLAQYMGCPDTDNDSIPDLADLCPTEAGPKDNKGCPYKDKDGDGLLDKDDKCPEQAGPKENKGCPIGDKDGDGTPDNKDDCPNVAGPADNKGCPKLAKEEQEILDLAFANLEFETGKDVIKESSFDEMNKLAELLMKKKDWKLRISGHTDNVGDPKKNLDLSKRRAKAVKTFLTSKGVDASRMIDEGFGSKKPIADNKKPEGRQKNRRVEMKVLFE